MQRPRDWLPELLAVVLLLAVSFAGAVHAYLAHRP